MQVFSTKIPRYSWFEISRNQEGIIIQPEFLDNLGILWKLTKFCNSTIVSGLDWSNLHLVVVCLHCFSELIDLRDNWVAAQKTASTCCGSLVNYMSLKCPQANMLENISSKPYLAEHDLLICSVIIPYAVADLVMAWLTFEGKQHLEKHLICRIKTSIIFFIKTFFSPTPL